MEKETNVKLISNASSRIQNKGKNILIEPMPAENMTRKLSK